MLTMLCIRFELGENETKFLNRNCCFTQWACISFTQFAIGSDNTNRILWRIVRFHFERASFLGRFIPSVVSLHFSMQKCVRLFGNVCEFHRGVGWDRGIAEEIWFDSKNDWFSYGCQRVVQLFWWNRHWILSNIARHAFCRCRFFHEARSLYSFSFASMFFWSIIDLAASLYIFEMVIGVLWFFHVERCFCKNNLLSENGAFWWRYTDGFCNCYDKHFMDLFPLFVGKIGHRSIWWMVKLFIRFKMVWITHWTAKVLHCDAGKYAKTILFSRIQGLRSEFGNVY